MKFKLLLLICAIIISSFALAEELPIDLVDYTPKTYQKQFIKESDDYIEIYSCKIERVEKNYTKVNEIVSENELVNNDESSELISDIITANVAVDNNVVDLNQYVTDNCNPSWFCNNNYNGCFTDMEDCYKLVSSNACNYAKLYSYVTNCESKNVAATIQESVTPDKKVPFNFPLIPILGLVCLPILGLFSFNVFSKYKKRQNENQKIEVMKQRFSDKDFDNYTGETVSDPFKGVSGSIFDKDDDGKNNDFGF